MKIKSTKNALISSALALVLCVSMLAGTTFAWFTDSVTSANNVIAAGNLDVGLSYSDSFGGTYLDAEQHPIFTYEKWEPGYTEVKYVKIANNGSLAFKFRLDVLPNSTPADGDPNLADVLDVYMIKNPTAAITKDNLTDKVGTLSEVIEMGGGAFNGIIVPAGTTPNDATTEDVGETLVAIAIKMQESAGNEYKNASVGGGFSVRVLATQYNYESDSFDKDYDSGAEIIVPVSNARQLINAVKAGSDIALENTITIDEKFIDELENAGSASGFSLVADVISNDAILDGNGITVWRNAESVDEPLFTVKSGINFALSNITVDGGAVWGGAVDETLGRGTVNTGLATTGAIVALESGASLVLGKDAVLQNNDGAYAVNLGTRIGATLTLDGGSIINNNSGAGAVWGGGNIVINSGAISHNSSTGLAGAIRMVSNCNLTMNGGEMNCNKAATDGGVVWGYGSSTYNLNGGEIANNSCSGTGGAFYLGTYSVVNIGGNFEMHDNKASSSGAVRFTDHCSLNMTGGKIYNNTQNGEDNCFNTWNNSFSITGGEISDNISYVGGLGFTLGKADVTGVVSFGLSTTHNTAYLASEFNGFSFTVNEGDANFASFNLKPAAGYVYADGDEAKLNCLNDGYTMVWDAASATFKIAAK